MKHPRDVASFWNDIHDGSFGREINLHRPTTPVAEPHFRTNSTSLANSRIYIHDCGRGM